MFLCYALINHSCNPNVFMDLTYGKETTGELRALRDIKRGEEINDSYIMLGYRNKKQRQDDLRNWSKIIWYQKWFWWRRRSALNFYWFTKHMMLTSPLPVSGGSPVSVPPAPLRQMMPSWPPPPDWRLTSGARWPGRGLTRTGGRSPGARPGWWPASGRWPSPRSSCPWRQLT